MMYEVLMFWAFCENMSVEQLVQSSSASGRPQLLCVATTCATTKRPLRRGDDLRDDEDDGDT